MYNNKVLLLLCMIRYTLCMPAVETYDGLYHTMSQKQTGFKQR